MDKVTKPGLREQKQDVVRDALYGAAVELFAAKGFEETTVEEVAQATGVSRSTFFRHFESKDDLLSYPMLGYGSALTDAVRAGAPHGSQMDVLREAVLAGAAFTLNAATRTRQVIEISSRSAVARQAYQSRMMQLDERLIHAYAERFGYEVTVPRPRILAGITLAVLNASIVDWARRQESDLRAMALQSVSELRSILDSDAGRPSA